jgi:3',5'-cyclic AMP phosphodiesterase CpdA
MTVAPDHICVTGDLTNIALPAEFAAAAEWLAGLGDPEDVSVVPGNHDAYIAMPPAETFDLWRAWMRGDDGTTTFPYLRRRGSAAIIGVSSAVPTAPFLATGRLAPAQRARLEQLLTRLGQEGLFRVVLIHHPPQHGAVRTRHQLSDAGAVRQLLATAGAELVLHGHAHRQLDARLPGPGPQGIPVLGVGAASTVGGDGRTPGHYHLFRLEAAGGQHRPTVEHRHFDPAAGRFIRGATQVIAGAGAASPPPPSAAAGAR